MYQNLVYDINAHTVKNFLIVFSFQSWKNFYFVIHNTPEKTGIK